MKILIRVLASLVVVLMWELTELGWPYFLLVLPLSVLYSILLDSQP